MYTAIIPAKGKSTRVHAKNMRSLGGKPLLDWTIEFASNSNLINEIVISTDSEEVLSKSTKLKDFSQEFHSIKSGSVVQLDKGLLIHKRSNAISKPNTPTIELTFECLTNGNFINSSFILLQPTSPFRDYRELEEIVELHRKNQNESVVSVHKVDSPHPSKTFKLHDAGEIDKTSVRLGDITTPSEDLGSYFAPDGAYYIFDHNRLILDRAFITEKTKCFVRGGPKSVNIDTELDFLFASFLLEKNIIQIDS